MGRRTKRIWTELRAEPNRSYTQTEAVQEKSERKLETKLKDYYKIKNKVRQKIQIANKIQIAEAKEEIR